MSHIGYVFFCAHEFEGVEEWDVVFVCEDGAYGCVVDAEVRISACNDGFEVVGIVFVVEEGCYLFWYVRGFFTV